MADELIQKPKGCLLDLFASVQCVKDSQKVTSPAQFCLLMYIFS